MRKVGGLIKDQRDWEEMKKGDVVEFVCYENAGNTGGYDYVVGELYTITQDRYGDLGPMDSDEIVPDVGFNRFIFKYVSLIDQKDSHDNFKIGDEVRPNPNIRPEDYEYGYSAEMMKWWCKPDDHKGFVDDVEGDKTIVRTTGYGTWAYTPNELIFAKTQEKETMSNDQFDMKKLPVGTLVTVECGEDCLITKSLDSDEEYQIFNIDDNSSHEYISYSDIEKVHGVIRNGVLSSPEDMNIPKKPSYNPSQGDLVVSDFGGIYIVRDDGVDADGDISVGTLYGSKIDYLDLKDVEKVIGKISANGVIEAYEY